MELAPHRKLHNLAAPGRKWWKEHGREQALIYLVGVLDLSYPETAKRLGTTPGSICGKANRLGIGKGPRTRERCADAIFLKPTAKPSKLVPHAAPDHVYAKVIKRHDDEAARRVGIPMHKLEDRHCRFPIGDPANNHYCGFTRKRGAYCQHHADRCFSNKSPESHDHQPLQAPKGWQIRGRHLTQHCDPVDARSFELAELANAT